MECSSSHKIEFEFPDFEKELIPALSPANRNEFRNLILWN